MTAPSGPWRLITEDVHNGPMQMALDEVAAATAADDGPWTLRVYTWSPSALSLGYHQDPETIDWAFCEGQEIDIVRRPTGGGAIYHDTHGDISYSLVAPAEALPGDLMETYELLCEPLFDALEALGVDATLADESAPSIHEPACYLRGIDPAHDVVAPDDRKLSGNAQYRRHDSVIQHGSLTYQRFVDRHLAPFVADIDAEKFRSRVTSVYEQAGVERPQVIRALESAFRDWSGAHNGEWSANELERAQALATSKYESAEWTRRRKVPNE